MWTSPLRPDSHHQDGGCYGNRRTRAGTGLTIPTPGETIQSSVLLLSAMGVWCRGGLWTPPAARVLPPYKASPALLGVGLLV